MHTKDVLQVRVGRFQSEPPDYPRRDRPERPALLRCRAIGTTGDCADQDRRRCDIVITVQGCSSSVLASLQAPIVASDKPAFVPVNTRRRKKVAVAQVDPGPDANSRASTCCCSDEASYCAGQDRRRRKIAAKVNPGSDTESCASRCCGSGETSGGADQERRPRKVVAASQIGSNSDPDSCGRPGCGFREADPD